LAEELINVGSAITVGTFCFQYIMSLIVNGPLQSLLNKMKALSLSCHMMAVRLIIPAVCQKIFGVIFEATIFDVFPLEIPYDYITGVEIVDPPTAELELVGYDSIPAIRNIGSLFLIITWAYLMIMLVSCCSYCCKDDPYAPCQDKFLKY
jgi:hypothetical protein